MTTEIENQFNELLTDAVSFADDDPSYLSIGKVEFKQIPTRIALVKILTDIEQFKTADDYKQYAIGWMWPDSDGDVVVSIYAEDEIDTNDPDEKCNCSNYDFAHDLIQQALTIKYNELF